MKEKEANKLLEEALDDIGFVQDALEGTLYAELNGILDEVISIIIRVSEGLSDK